MTLGAFHPIMMFGRELEQTRLRQMLTASIEGSGGTVMVSGRAGIGKTTLIEDLMYQAQQLGVEVVSGGGYDLSIMPPYGVWIDAFAHAVETGYAGLLRQEPSDQAHVSGQSDFFASVVRLVLERAVARPMLIALEDLHWADSASLDLLRYLARNVRGRHVLIVLSYRDDELSTAHPLLRLLPALVREARAERIALHPLQDSDVQALVTMRFDLPAIDQARLVRYLQRHAEGNPFFLGELLRTLQEQRLLQPSGSIWTLGELENAPVPPLVLQVIEGRLDNLDPATRRLLEAAAVIGQVVPVDLWQRTVDVSQDELIAAVDQAGATHLLKWLPGDSRIHFDHALTREALYSGIPPPRRRALHQRVTDVLFTYHQADPDMISHHAQQAGDPRAVEWLVRAGLRARRAGAWVTASGRFRMAAALLESSTTHTRQRGWLLFYTGFLLRFAGDARILEYLDEAQRVALEIDDRLLLAIVIYHRGASRNMRGDVRTGVAELREGIARLSELSAEIANRETEEQARSVVESLIPGHAAEPQPGSSSPPDRTSSAQIIQQNGVMINWVGMSGQFRETVERGNAFVQQLDQVFGNDLRHPSQAASVFLGLGHAYAALGEPEQARKHLEIARRDFSQASDFSITEFTYHLELLLIAIPYRTDDVAGRNRLREEAARLWNRSGGASLASNAGRAPSELGLLVIDGNWDAAYQHASDMKFASTIREFQEAHLILAYLDHKRGASQRAREFLLHILPDGPATEPGGCMFSLGIRAVAIAADIALDAEDLEEASDWIETHHRWLEWSAAVLWKAGNRLLRARLHMLAGDMKQARLYALEALRLASEPRQPLQLASVLRLLGDLDREEGAFEQAEGWLRSSLEIAEACQIPYEVGLTKLSLAALHSANGNVAASHVHLRHAREIFSRIGASSDLNRLEDMASSATATTKPPAGYPDGLTHREVEVLRLLAAGNTNRRIADKLFLSTRTVERHVANIYVKINVHNKSGATAYAHRRNLV